MSRVILAEYYRPRHVRELVGNKASRYAYILRLGGTIALRRLGLTGMKALEYAYDLFKKVFGVEFKDAFAKFRSERSKELILGITKKISDGTLPPVALLVGPPGVGKTSLVYAAANDIGRDVFELNASDFRTAEKVRKYVLKALMYPSFDPETLEMKDHIVFLDEIDGLSAFGDTGGATELYRIIKQDQKKKFIKYPLTLAANDRSASAVKLLMPLSVVIPFFRLSRKEVYEVLRRIFIREAKRRGLRYDKEKVEEALRRIARASNGDLRSAIEDLQVFIETGEVHVSRKNRELTIREILKTLVSDRVKTLDDVKRELMNLDEDPKLFIYRVLENIPNFVKTPSRRAEAYRLLADADLHYERAQRGNRSLLRYVTPLAASAIALYAEHKPKRSQFMKVNIQKPEYFERLQQTREIREILKQAYMTAAKKIHVSRKKFVEDVLPYLRVIAMYRPEILKTLGFSDDAIIAIVPKDQQDRVAKLLEEAKRKKKVERKQVEKKEEKAEKTAETTPEAKEVKKEEKKQEKRRKKASKRSVKEAKEEKKTLTLEDILKDFIRCFSRSVGASSSAAWPLSSAGGRLT